ncbi:MAG TPA: glycosyltransferase family 2 protein, partial [Candidatus Avacidaminococcus intestinavium]|nr:glycosyltransferase family 2 protein [Candidatus Avacidaminococcus intestinavium]
MSKHISIVVPVYNEQDNLCEFYKRLDHVMTNTDYAYNIIFVDDGSTDDSPLLLTDLVKREEHAEVYLLSRNFGHQMALTCGLEHAEGDAVIMMDGDLQHPPELLPVLFKLWEDGYE